MARNLTAMKPCDEEAAVKLSTGISRVVLSYIKSRGLTQTEVACQLGYTRASFCQMVNAADPSRLWRLPAICGVCRVLGVQVDELIAAAMLPEGKGDIRSSTLWVLTIGSEPRSLDRLQSFIADVEDKTISEAEDVHLFELGARCFVDDFRSGKLSDRRAYDILRQAEAERRASPTNGKILPLWATVAEMYQ